ncbi:putative 37S ribosomal protein S18, partial [Thermoascus aurantiacus ATCC 26904]
RLLTRRRLPTRQRLMEDQKSQSESRILERFQTRDWKAGDIYAPHDLSPEEMKKWRKRHSPSRDAFDALNMNPLDQYKNFAIMSEYMTPMGRIKHRSQTGLRPVNQRKIAKAIRRAIGLGLMPSVHRHPEILAAEAKARLDAGGVA